MKTPITNNIFIQSFKEKCATDCLPSVAPEFFNTTFYTLVDGMLRECRIKSIHTIFGYDGKTFERPCVYLRGRIAGLEGIKVWKFNSISIVQGNLYTSEDAYDTAVMKGYNWGDVLIHTKRADNILPLLGVNFSSSKAYLYYWDKEKGLSYYFPTINALWIDENGYHIDIDDNEMADNENRFFSAEVCRFAKNKKPVFTFEDEAENVTDEKKPTEIEVNIRIVGATLEEVESLLDSHKITIAKL